MKLQLETIKYSKNPEDAHIERKRFLKSYLCALMPHFK